MSIKPIDFQVMLPKTAEVSKTINDNHQKNLVMHQNTADSLHQKSESEVRTVHSQEKATGPEIKDKKDREKKNKKDNKKNKQKDNNESIIDIRL